MRAGHDPADQGRRAPQLRGESKGEEFALEALATSDSWDAGAGRVFTFPSLSALRHPWGPFPAEQVLGGGSGDLGASAGPAPSLPGDACRDRDVGWGSHGPKPHRPYVLRGAGGSPVHTRFSTPRPPGSGSAGDSESPSMVTFLLGFSWQGVNPSLLLASGRRVCKRVLPHRGAGGSWHPRVRPPRRHTVGRRICALSLGACGSAPEVAWAAPLGAEPLPPRAQAGQRVTPGAGQHCMAAWHRQPSCSLN